MVDIISRAAWGATPWRGTTYRVPITERTEFFVHYHGGIPRHDRGDANARDVEDIHLDNGWAGVGYNFLVGQDGEIREGRGWDLVGAHCPGHNRSGIGVYVAIGEGQQPSQAALRSVRALYDELVRRREAEIAKKGHRDGKPTACPGDPLYAWVRGGMIVDGAAPLPPARIDEPEPSGRPVLRNGSRGRHVVPLQTRLNALQWGDLQVDGIFGPATEAAVRRLQAAAGVTVDGVVGPVTHGLLDRGVHRPAVPRFPGTVRRGDKGMAVRAVQERLRQRGWLDSRRKPIAVDGIFGRETEIVVRAFQAEKRLVVDGIAGPATWNALWSAPVT